MSTVLPAATRVERPAVNVWLYVWAAIAIAAVVAAAAMQTGIGHMIETWMVREEYSHALLIPVISLYLLWQQRAALWRMEFKGSWLGVGLIAFGALLQIAGVLAAVDTIQQYGLLFAIYGLVLALIGVRQSVNLWAPLLLLALMVPLPEFLLQNFSAQLQLISSQVGVWFIRLFGISVFVEGNVIDLGGYKLQVAEACDGLRYLFPLMTMGFIMAYMFKVEMWKRVLLFVSSIPVTILMNSFRIGTIGVMVEHWGQSMAEGFLHDFQGWAVFMTSAGVLLIEMMLLAKIGKHRRPWREVFGLDAAEPIDRNAAPVHRTVPASFIAGSLIVSAFAVGVLVAPERAEATPTRESFFAFPTQVDSWTGRRSVLEQIYLDALKLDDYIMADYMRGGREMVNFYVAWYDSQRAGNSAHSPRSCLPGGGWRMTQFNQVDVGDVQVAGKPLRVNRVQIELGNRNQLVYYWFQQRGRVVTNEYLVKWYLFVDSLTKQRTDGALVRLVTPLDIGEPVEQADRRLVEFASQVAPRLEHYVPN
ncbi:VPLPA-CTERM-specific exosortase XrtD [Steroidobacter sp.]|uniref:VPLPA-CTERM-specific exosortase XrtD n=1 Tax=Steroidobacter sp. TaxID=1978227 RepID=UPI001A4AAB25|nr:VPLPA-CTERM-specific exosortase XrtD [Steroidobacter sp.]MBL8267848.1 VPLPA-CTERM-specific exosortase XrtD [Steroidobacter sp.]